MPYYKSQGMNKEKLVFYLCFVLMMVSAFLFFFGPRTQSLRDDEPITSKARPEAYDAKGAPVRLALELAADRERKSPFTPDLTWKTNVANKKPPNPGKAPPPPPPPPPPPQPQAQPKPKSAMTPTEKDLEVGFMGVVQVGDQSYALLSSKDGSAPRRVKEGDVLDGLNYTITKIEKQSIFLTDGDGRPYILKDGRFDALADNTGPSSNAPSFTDPNKPKTPPNNTPKPQPKNPPFSSPPSTSPPRGGQPKKNGPRKSG
ncbi:MAG: hypothetical protein HY291_06275 [Planctomycetes bacterium]|nr:hypothetical protein [Planctomycetota bacterium]